MSAERVRDVFGRLAVRSLDIATYFEESGLLLRRAVGFDGFCSMTVDPATMLLTSHIAHDSVRPEDVPLLGRNEFAEEDVNKFAVLARSPRPSGVLIDATAGRPDTSLRFETILQPNGITDELRVSLLDGAACWGWIAMYRRGGPPFSVADAELVAGVAQPLAQGLRRSILLSCAATDDGPQAPGLILFAGDGQVEAISPPAQALLGSLIATDTAPDGLPAIVYSVAYRARLAAGDPEQGARARVPTAMGSWLTLHGSVVGDPEHGRIAVILERTRPLELAPVITAAYGLSPRETEVRSRCCWARPAWRPPLRCTSLSTRSRTT